MDLLCQAKKEEKLKSVTTIILVSHLKHENTQTRQIATLSTMSGYRIVCAWATVDDNAGYRTYSTKPILTARQYGGPERLKI